MGAVRKVLYLADRNILVDQTKDGDFKPLQKVTTKVEHRKLDPAYEVYFALYQQLVGENGEEIFRVFDRSFFDLVIVDECHRGSADEDSAWRKILEYFDDAIQIGMTATPKETKDVSNIAYDAKPLTRSERANNVKRSDYFAEYKERHAFGEIYETILKDLQSAGNAGEFYTPRAVTDFMAEMLDPKLGESVADFACGTGGFLTSALKLLAPQVKTPADQELYSHSIYGIEELVAGDFNFDLCGYPHEEEVILPPDELIRNYRIERARLDAEIDAKLVQVCEILGIEVM